MLGCGRRGHPAVTHGPAYSRDGYPQPDGAGRSHQEQPCEEGVGDNPSLYQAPHLPATLRCQQSQQPREEVAPWCAFEQGASKTIVVPPAHECLCTPSLSAPFWQPGQPTQQREAPSASAAAGEHLSICPPIPLSREWVKQPVPHPTRPAWASRHGRERFTAGAHYGTAIKRVETLPPTLIRGASQLCALKPRDEVQGLFTTSCETGEFCPCQVESRLIPPRSDVLHASPK